MLLKSFHSLFFWTAISSLSSQELCEQFGSFDENQNHVVNISQISNFTLRKGMDAGDQMVVQFNPTNSTSYVTVELKNQHKLRPWLLKAQVSLNKMSNIASYTQHKHGDKWITSPVTCDFVAKSSFNVAIFRENHEYQVSWSCDENISFDDQCTHSHGTYPRLVGAMTFRILDIRAHGGVRGVKICFRSPQNRIFMPVMPFPF